MGCLTPKFSTLGVMLGLEGAWRGWGSTKEEQEAKRRREGAMELKKGEKRMENSLL